MEKWARQSAAVFNPQKTVLVHFTRNETKLLEADKAPTHIQFGQETIKAQAEVKILGVVLDQRLSYKQHIAQAVKRGIKAALALKRLKNLRPEIPRQLFVSTIAPVVDYASPIWAPGATISALRILDDVQRIGTQAGIGGSSTVARCVAESKAGVEPAILRHHNQQRAAWIKWHTKPESHRFWKIKTALSITNKRWVSPLQKIAQKFASVDVLKIVKIGAYARDPTTSTCSVFIPGAKQQAIELAKSHDGSAAFVDSSSRNSLVGIRTCWQSLGWPATASIISNTSTL